MSFCGLLLTYGLNTWLPKIMEGYGYGRTYSLFFPLALNLGAVAGGLLASRLADKSGPQRVIAATFALATISLALMTFSFPLPLLFAFIALAGVGTLGTQVLVYGFQSNYFTTNARAAGVAWCASVGRLGGVLGPIIGGWLAAAGIGGSTAFYIYGAVALFGAVVTVLVPRQRKLEEAEHKVEEIAEGRAKDSSPSEVLR
jgi:AAHS family benzoate transporter-like MFS transporter